MQFYEFKNRLITYEKYRIILVPKSGVINHDFQFRVGKSQCKSTKYKQIKYLFRHRKQTILLKNDYDRTCTTVTFMSITFSTFKTFQIEVIKIPLQNN